MILSENLGSPRFSFGVVRVSHLFLFVNVIFVSTTKDHQRFYFQVFFKDWSKGDNKLRTLSYEVTIDIKSFFC